MGIKENDFSQTRPNENAAPHLAATHVVTLVEAINLALARALEMDERVVLLGEDIGTNGGVFRATSGLKQRFGCRRVMDTPLAEALIAGVSVGMAAQGLKPVAEIQFMGFIYASLEHLISHAARLRHRTRGRLHCPLVVRTPFGGGIHAPEHHCESTEALFAQIPGLRVVVPSSPARAYGLLLSAIDDPDPVIFLEPARLYRLMKQEICDDGTGLPLDTCFTLRPGREVTLVSWGACVQDALAAARELEQQQISAEVIDVATLNPIDYDTLLASVEKTGRCVIVQEAPRPCSVATDIAARLAEKGLLFLKAPVEIVSGFDTPIPYFRQEKLYLPDVHDIVSAVRRTLEFA